MDENRLRFGVGVLVIAAIGIGVILTFLFGAFPAILNREYTLHIYFPSAEGINTNSPVLRDGVKVGRVSDIKLRDQGGVELTLAMDQEYAMSHQYVPQIGIGSLITGDSKLEFRKADPRELKIIHQTDPSIIERPYSDGELVNYGRKLEDPFTLLFGMEDELRSTFQSVRGAGDAVTEIGSSLKGLVEDVRGFIGIEGQMGGPVPTSWTPPQSAVSLASLQNTCFGDGRPRASGLPPAPDWASPLILVSGTEIDSQPRLILQTVAMQNTNQFTPPTFPPTTAPPATGNTPQPLQPGVTPPTAVQPKITLADLQREAIETLNELQAAIRDARSIVGDEEIRKGLSDSIRRFPGVLNDASEALQTTQQTFDSFIEVGQQFEQVGAVAEAAIKELKVTAGDTLKSFQGTAENVEAFTRPLGERSDELVEQALRSLANLDNVLVQVDTFGQTLNNSNGTVKRLLEDDELYDELRRTIQNVEAATARIRPILDDVRVFTDKLSRDPRQLGVRGALGGRPTGAGLK